MRILHVAALSFPTPQGTQALLHRMADAHARAGHETHLLCYPHAAQGVPCERAYRLHRCAGEQLPASLHSGPTLAKLALDGALAWALRACVRRLRPGLVIAHHVEAAAIAHACGVPFVFYAHTDLGAELPSYFAPALALALRGLGARVDAALLRSARVTWAVSPQLAHQLGRGVCVPPLPWLVEAPPTADERARARAGYGFSPTLQVALYAGNLDAYQGLEALVREVARVRRPGLRWLIATASPLRDFTRVLAAHGLLARVRFAPLRDEASRRRAYAACDFALVPRAVPGGVPIKLFDALARGVPTIAARAALAGYPLGPYCRVVDEGGWRDALEAHLDERGGNADAQRAAAAGRAYLATAHAPARFAAAL